jgi:hypothetical protein
MHTHGERESERRGEEGKKERKKREKEKHHFQVSAFHFAWQF